MLRQISQTLKEGKVLATSLITVSVVIFQFISMTSSVAADTVVKATPDTWLYCSKTVPVVETREQSYAGIYARPDVNSVTTMCRDLVKNSWFFWYSARPVNNWNLACSWTTSGIFPKAYYSNNHVYCRR